MVQSTEIRGCILPWIHMYGGMKGIYNLCCHSELSASKPLVLGTHDQKMSDVWNNNEYKQARLDLLNNKIPLECVETCYNIEKQSGFSNRTQVNKRFKDKAYLQSETKKDGSLKELPSYIDIRFGNLCNFKCRMCGPYASTSWYKDWNTNSNNKYTNTIDFFTKNNIFWDSLYEIIPTIEDVYFAGGEPFVQDGHYRLLETLIDTGRSKYVSLQYNTNLSYSKFKNFDLSCLWQHFKKVELWPSIEGYKEKAEYSRKGLKWEIFEKNTILFKKYITTFSCVISIYTISSMPSLILWIKKLGLHFYGTILQTPQHLSITSLPKESKKQINLIYKKFLTKHRKAFNNYEINQIKEWLIYMNSVDNSSLLPKFKKEQQRLDALRNESFEKVFPEFEIWYKNISV